jgi:N,N-dimethylformamidase
MVSTTEPAYELRIDRIRTPHTDKSATTAVDPATERPLIRTVLTGREQITQMGSCAQVAGMRSHLSHRPHLTITAWIMPTFLSGASQALVSTSNGESGVGWELFIDRDGHLAFMLAGDTHRTTVRTPIFLSERRWHFVYGGYSLPHNQISVGYTGIQGRSDASTSSIDQVRDLSDMSDTLVIAAASSSSSANGTSRTTRHFNGRLEDVQLAPVEPRVELYHDNERLGTEDLLAQWDFTAEPESTIIRDRSRFKNDGRLINMPTRLARGHSWTSEFMDPRACPQEYGAIHFHDDDIGDVGWPPDLTWPVPTDAPSGVYAAVLEAGSQRDEVPFVILPSARRPTPEVVVVLPTLTYQAYANSRIMMEQDPEIYGASAEAVTAHPTMELLAQHPEWGRSLYDVHRDGSGCMYTSSRRPLLTMRPSFLSAVTRSPRNFSADILLLTWLNKQRIEYDVVTDLELHSDADSALKPYRVALTGSHPEYCTRQMLDGLQAFLANGSRLMYLGGNGYYWVTTVHPECPDTIEVRRGDSGSRPWTSEPGENHHSTTGEPGGLWRSRDRPPNQLVGVGFSAHSWGDRAGHYTRLPASFDERYRWIFDGVPDNARIGDHGLIMGGAAGDELDRHDATLGSPASAVRLATSSGLPDQSYPAIEELHELTPDLDRLRTEFVRADMVYFETDCGGAVFSVGSLCWIGSLLTNDGDNHVSRITANVLRRFARGSVA